ncbi:MAG: hypothetical protein OHK0038_07720 [Flammeovirgaceae bacterium]
MELDAQSDFITNTKSIRDFIKGLDYQRLNKKPSAKEWSVIECLEHLIVIEKSVEKVLELEAVAPRRSYFSKIDMMKNSLLNFDQKYETTEMFYPIGLYSDANKAIEEFEKQREQISQKGDLKMLYIGIEHPFFGKLTKLEWIYFCIFHAQRHFEQMKKAILNLD